MIKILSDKEYKELLEIGKSTNILKEHIDFLEKEYAKTLNTPSISDKDRERLADLEVKMAKLWGILLETTPKGKDKLTRFGKRFGGQSKQFL